jgi:hypothetical protein
MKELLQIAKWLFIIASVPMALVGFVLLFVVFPMYLRHH